MRWVGAAAGDAEADGLAPGEALAEGDAAGLAEADALALGEGAAEPDGLAPADGLAAALADADGLAAALPDGLADGESLAGAVVGEGIGSLGPGVSSTSQAYAVRGAKAKTPISSNPASPKAISRGVL